MAIRRATGLLFSLFLISACATQATLDEPAIAMGDFRLGHNIVVVQDPEIGPFSRKATDEELQAALELAIDRRLGLYEGEKFYNLGIKIDAYALALPGVPVVFNPKSLLVLTASIWDDAAGERLNVEEKVFTVFEGTTGKTLLSSGLTQNKATQLENLTNNAARDIQNWILDNPEWVGLPPKDAEPEAAEAEAVVQSDIDIEALPAN